MDDMVTDDPASQYAPLGSVFIAIAIVVWTSVAVWLCHGNPPGTESGGVEDESHAVTGGSGDLADGVISRVANGFAELLLESKEKGASGGDARSLDLSKLEDLLSASKGDCKAAAVAALTAASASSANNAGTTAGGLGSAGNTGTAGANGTAKKNGVSGRGPLSKLPGKDGGGALGTMLAGLTLGKDGDKDASVSFDPRATPSPARASGDGRNRSAFGVVGGDDADKTSLDLAAFREQLKEKLSSSLNAAGGRKAGSDDLSWPVAGSTRSRVDVAEDFLKQLLHPALGGLRGDDKSAVSGAAAIVSRAARGKLAEVDGEDKEGAARHATMISMAEHAREIGNKYLQDRHFAAAAHCYEVACLLYPSGGGGSSHAHLAAYHCNCALACLELGRYGDAINEGNAALVLTPPKHLAVKALYRLAVAHANLKNTYEARRCLKRCLELDPGNEYSAVFLGQLGEEEQAGAPHQGPGARLTWIDPPKRVQCLGTAAREKAKGRKTKQKVCGGAAEEIFGGTGGGGCLNGGKDAGSQVRLDREAGLWHTVARHNNKLYLLGGRADGPGVLGLPGDGPGCQARGSDELHVLDVETLELRQLTGPNSKPPHACYCHTATMVGTNMVVFGGCGSAVGQPPLVMVFDVQLAKWRLPPTTGLPPRQRQGHTANAVQGDRYLCIFGGIEPTGEHRVARIYSDAHLLDLQSFAWRKLEVSGYRPPARFGHTATNLPGSSSKLLVVGGRDHLGVSGVPGGFSGLHILDTELRTWTEQSFSGTPPSQAFYHSAIAIDDQTILYLASGASQQQQQLLPLHLLDIEAWRWSTPSVSGPGPSPRVGHSATLVGGRVYVFGGLVRRDGHVAVDKAMYVLDTSQLRCEQREAPQEAARVGHAANPMGGKCDQRAKNERTKTDAKAIAAIGPEKQTEHYHYNNGFGHHSGLGINNAGSHANNGGNNVHQCGYQANHGAGGNANNCHGNVHAGGHVPGGGTVAAALCGASFQANAQVGLAAKAGAAGGGCGGATVVKETVAGNKEIAGGQPSATTASLGLPAPVPAPTTTAPTTARRTVSRDERIERMLQESGFDENIDDAPELSFEELLEQEKAFFKAQSEKVSFPRAGGKDGGRRAQRF